MVEDVKDVDVAAEKYSLKYGANLSVFAWLMIWKKPVHLPRTGNFRAGTWKWSMDPRWGLVCALMLLRNKSLDFGLRYLRICETWLLET